MRPGIREIVPVVLLLVALGIAYKFLDPAGGSSGTSTPASRTATPPQVATPTPAPTDAPPKEVTTPDGWVVKFVSLTATGGERVDVQVGLNALDFSYPAAPFPDMRDDGWKLVAVAVSELPSAGRYAFSFEHDGEARLFVDDREAAAEPDGAGLQTLRAVFEHPGGPLILRIEVRDVKGPLKLKLP